ncbi:MAG: hypothetical protein P8Y70_05370 [Candidatus Lokiarchaeota archaeon]
MVILRNLEKKENLNQILFPLSIFLLTISFVLDRLAFENGIIAFINGVFMGMSCVFLIVYLFLTGRKLREKNTNNSET